VSPKRPGYGTTGRDIQLQANFFELKLPKGDIHHYDVTITPDKCPRAVNHAVVQTMVDQYHRMFGGQKPVYDGRKNLYSRSPLPIDKEKVSLFSITSKMILQSFKLSGANLSKVVNNKSNCCCFRKSL
jgi:eukaryotic translation initiation factor 2C